MRDSLFISTDMDSDHCTDHNPNRAILEPFLWDMMAREGFKGLTLDDLKLLANKIVVPYIPDEIDEEDEEQDQEQQA